MLTRTVLSVEELAQIFDSIWEFNRRGQVYGLIFVGADGQPVTLSGIEVVSEERGIAVRTKPDPTPQEAAMASMHRPLMDPRVVAPPQNIEELAAVGG